MNEVDSGRPASPRRLRVYDTLRSAHLERLTTAVPAQMWHLRRRDDFDPALLENIEAPEQVDAKTILRRLTRSSFDTIEILEPGMVDQWKILVPLVLTVRARDLLTRHHTEIAFYCIENSDPAERVTERWPLRGRAARLLTWLVVNLLVRTADRIAIGTEGSARLYESYVGSRALRRRQRTFEALPAHCECLTSDRSGPDSPGETSESDARRGPVLFVGSFVERKGIRELMAGWDALRSQRQGLDLVLVGTGTLQHEVEEWAAARAEATVVIDPPRAEVHRWLRKASVLVLLSQPAPPWREQVGLPIVEGLAHGCEIVTTTETGLADWLLSHGHQVLEPQATPAAVARAIEAAVDAARPSGSLSELPSVDSRMAADHWMMTGSLSGRGASGVV